VRLSEWRAAAPHADSMADDVMGVINPVLAGVGAPRDPHCWVVWGEEPQTRYTMLVPTEPGLAVIAVRVRIPGEGAHVSGRLIRWSRVQIGDLAVEGQSGHRLVTVQLEHLVLRGLDAEADRMSAFMAMVFAGIDGRPIPGIQAEMVSVG
jgi:hypothetical protein